MADYASVPAAWRFVGGRRHYNRLRREAAEARRRRLIDLICDDEHVTQRYLARALGVSDATVSRDLSALCQGVHWRYRVKLGRLFGIW